MRVLFIHSTALAPASGENIRGNHLLRRLSREHEIDLVAPRSGVDIPGNVRSFLVGNVSRFGRNKELRYLDFGVRAALLKRKLRREYDVVYCFGLAGTLLAARFAGKAKLVCDFYEVDFPELRTTDSRLVKLMLKTAGVFHRWIMRKADTVLLLTKHMEEYAARLTGANTVTVYDAADRDMFNGGVTKDHETFTVIFHGGIMDRDNVITLLMAVERVLEEEDVKLIIAGRGDALQGCMEYASNRPRLKEAVQFTGWVDYKEIPGYLARADLAVIPCEKEPINDYVIPRKAYEYMSCGIAITMTRLTAAEELFGDDEVYFIEEPTVGAIAGRIRQCINDRDEMASRSIRLMEIGDRINLQSECEKIVTVIEEPKSR